MYRPLVTIICLCHNHVRFVQEALDSVIAQTYQNFQLIIVDDASHDGSKRLIAGFVERNPSVTFVSHRTNVGVCKAFNSGLVYAQGELIIDLAADDVLLPTRLEAGVQGFAAHSEKFGVQFSDAYIIDEQGKDMGLHSDHFPSASVPSGNVYAELIRRYFICATSMMTRKKVLDEMQGYDENLLYEDFDLWIRSSRSWHYFYEAQPLVKRRIVKGGLHEKQFTSGTPHAWSTLAVCRKIFSLNKTREEQSALNARLRYEIRKALVRRDFKLAFQYVSLLGKNLSWSPTAD